ncbi:carbohydrate-binding module family 13 protein [Moesziomyces aphidis]|uniref:Carbohydrate-binding module family 13 protein n=1 Tax=Moesziomyces aphidis TaxID=84754 RepID=W3VK98_MOEAP|nr:carbohydrate-binding module family 13 protein [Moesziomyces aphidis]
MVRAFHRPSAPTAMRPQQLRCPRPQRSELIVTHLTVVHRARSWSGRPRLIEAHPVGLYQVRKAFGLLCHPALPFLSNSGLAWPAPALTLSSYAYTALPFLRLWHTVSAAQSTAKCFRPPRPNVQPGSSSNYIGARIPSSLHHLSYISHLTSSANMYAKSALLALLAGVIGVTAYDPAHMPAKTDAQGGQTGYNDCQQRYGASNPKAKCQNVFINSVKDFCLWGPPNTQSSDTVGNLEAVMVAYCMKSGYGTRLIPDGTIKGAHFLKTPSFVQVTGTGDFTKIHIRAGDEGGELDPHGATGSGNPVGGHVFTRAFTGNWEELPEWQNFMSANEYCFRACRAGPWAKNWCPHIYDVMGCMWNEPANYDAGVFEQCDGIEGQWPGVYSGSTWYQGVRPTPAAQPAGKSSNCRYYPSISNGPAIKTPSKRSVMATQVKRSPEWEEDY